MTKKNVSLCSLAAFFAFTLTFVATVSAASHEKVLQVFNGTPVEFPSSGLIGDSAGNLYGVTQGAVYELSPATGGGYTYSLLMTLPGGAGDGAGGNLARDSAGNLYGATHQGGANSVGYVYELSPAGASWTFNIVHSFGFPDGEGADHSVILDAAGNLYGTTFSGGNTDGGVAYELSPTGGGSWTYQILHNFASAEVGRPTTGLTLDAVGNLYGAGQQGIYKLAPQPGGGWSTRRIYTFNQTADGWDPQADLMIDPGGNLFGTTTGGGPNFSGTAFELSHAAGGAWTYTVLHSFGASGDGDTPFGGLVRDASGNLYGTTLGGGGLHAEGTAFKLSLVGGVWQETILHRFAGGTDGGEPLGTLLLSSGTLLGATGIGGSTTCNDGGGCGTVFSIR